MDPRDRLLAAHLRFEVARWSTDPRAEVAAEVTAWLTDLGPARLRDLAPRADVLAAVQRALDDPQAADRVADGFVDGLRAAHQRALDDPTAVGDLVGREAYDRVVGMVLDLRGLRAEVIRQVTTSSVYSRLLAHVLYHGLKGYLLSENAVARRVPGASSLLRLGQSALKSAAPGLEGGIDRQLTAFVNANIQDTIRDSRAYLEQALDDDLLRAVAAEIWDGNADRTVADLAGLLDEEAIDDAGDALAAAAQRLRENPRLRAAVEAAAGDLWDRWADRTVDDLLADAGLTPTAAGERVAEAATPVLGWLVESGVLARRLRARLAAFYATLPPDALLPDDLPPDA